jgi:hypothetical protein
MRVLDLGCGAGDVSMAGRGVSGFIQDRLWVSIGADPVAEVAASHLVKEPNPAARSQRSRLSYAI